MQPCLFDIQTLCPYASWPLVCTSVPCTILLCTRALPARVRRPPPNSRSSFPPSLPGILFVVLPCLMSPTPPPHDIIPGVHLFVVHYWLTFFLLCETQDIWPPRRAGFGGFGGPGAGHVCRRWGKRGGSATARASSREDCLHHARQGSGRAGRGTGPHGTSGTRADAFKPRIRTPQSSRSSAWPRPVACRVPGWAAGKGGRPCRSCGGLNRHGRGGGRQRAPVPPAPLCQGLFGGARHGTGKRTATCLLINPPHFLPTRRMSFS